MARTNVNYEDNRIDLIKKIWNIFLNHGYEKVTVALIIKELSLSKGRFYHYFVSKEECLDAVVKYYASKYREKAAIAINNLDSAQEKLKTLIQFGSKLHDTSDSYDDINKRENVIFHEKFMVALVKEFSPLYSDVISQGVNEGVFRVDFPNETAEMLLTLAQFYFDKGLFQWSDEEIESKVIAARNIFSKILGTDIELF